MNNETFIVLDEGQPCEMAAQVDPQRVRVSVHALKANLDWDVKPEGFCRGPVCVPYRQGGDLVTENGVDLAGFAELMGRPLALDIGERVAALGVSARARAQQLASLQAPDFTLPDLNGKLHSLSDYRGKRILLVAHASW